MEPEKLQLEIGLKYSFRKINSFSEYENFFTGEITKLTEIKEPCFVLFSKLINEGSYGEELDFEYISVAYFANACDFEIPEDATHFSIIREVPISEDDAKILQQRFATHSNFNLRIPAVDTFS